MKITQQTFGKEDRLEYRISCGSIPTLKHCSNRQAKQNRRVSGRI